MSRGEISDNGHTFLRIFPKFFVDRFIEGIVILIENEIHSFLTFILEYGGRSRIKKGDGCSRCYWPPLKLWKGWGWGMAQTPGSPGNTGKRGDRAGNRKQKQGTYPPPLSPADPGTHIAIPCIPCWRRPKGALMLPLCPGQQMGPSFLLLLLDQPHHQLFPTSPGNTIRLLLFPGWGKGTILASLLSWCMGLVPRSPSLSYATDFSLLAPAPCPPPLP